MKILNTKQGGKTPVLYIVSCLDQNIIQKIHQYDRLIISSMNGANALMNNMLMFAKHYIKQQIKAKQLYVVGNKSANILLEYGFHNILQIVNSINQLLSQFQDIPTLHISGVDSAYNNSIHNIEKLIVYKAIAIKLAPEVINAIIMGNISYVLVYSIRSAEIFLNHFFDKTPLHFITFICISMQVAGALSIYKAVYPNTPTEEAMLDLIK